MPLAFQQLGYKVEKVETFKGKKRVKDPANISSESFFNAEFVKTKVDELMLKGELEYALEDEGLRIKTEKSLITVLFDRSRFKPAEVQILMSETGKIRQLGLKIKRSLEDITRDQINYCLNPENRRMNRC